MPASGWKELVGEYKAYFKEKAGKRFPRRSDGAIVGRDRRGVWFVDGGEGGDLSPRGEDHRTAGHGRERRANGVRQHRRQFRNGRVLHARPELPAKRFSTATISPTRRAKTWWPEFARRCI